MFQTFVCLTCNKEKIRKTPPLCECTRLMQAAPQITSVLSKEPTGNGGSALVGQKKALLVRARVDTRENEMQQIVANADPVDAIRHGWVNAKGQIKKRIDDL